MRKGRVFFLIAFILILGLAAVAVVYFQFLAPTTTQPEVQVAPTPVIEMVDVVVASQYVPRGSVLNETLLALIQIPRELLIQGYFTDMADVVGRQARIDMEANMLVTNSMVVDSADQLSATGSLAALSIPKGMVAISIPINRLSSVSYAPQSGDHVNVIATLLMVDLDTEYQSLLPNYSSAVLAAGPGVITGSSAEGTSQATQGTNQAIDSLSSEGLGELQKITAQNVSGGPASVMGRAEIDPLLEQTYYLVPSEKQRPRLVSQTLLQDAIVLGVGEFPLEDEMPEEQPASSEVSVEGEETGGGTEEAPEESEPQANETQTEETEPALPDVITLIVTPQDAVTLNYLVFSGAQLTLALRSPGDADRPPTEAATLDYLLKTYQIPVPVKLPYGMEPRVDQLQPVLLPNDLPTEE
jgi:pilus assembly protein CpaB